MHDKMPPYAFNYFTGVPAPAGALMSLLPLVIALGFDAAWTMHPVVTGTWVAIMAALMVSRMPSYSFKRIRVPQRYVLPFLVTVGLTLAGLAAFPWIVLTGVAVVYLSTFPFSVRSYMRLKREAESMLPTVSDQPGDDGEFQAEDSQDKSDGSGPNLRSV